MLVLVLFGCGGAFLDRAAAPAPAASASDARSAEGTAGRPIVGVLRMRDREIVLTVDALDARHGDDLHRMTASAPPIMADIDPALIERAIGSGVSPEASSGMPWRRGE